MNNNFDKSFESLYKTAMAMADNCIVNKTIEQRFDKLEEEYQELIKEFTKKQHATVWTPDNTKEIKDEIGDVLFVLLHIAHKMDISIFQLLHAAASKMLARMNDPEYVAKN